MGKYDSYIARMEGSGNTYKESSDNVTKRNQVNLIMNSPSLSHVTLNDEENTRPSIVSDMETFNKRRFLFLPDSDIKVGNYVKHKDMTYLATDATTDEVYPQLIGEVCNQTFRLIKSSEQAIVGYKPITGQPIYETVEDVVDLPCVMTDQVYSALSNQAIPLPTGAMIMKIPYNVDHKVAINYSIKVRNSEYKTTEVSYEHVVNEVGFIEVHLMREVNERGN